ncbi:uncharacterized protein BDZ99DRAFT_533630 [Mytilinidion resinicola]|uniref:RING-type domain-containing protein n=1 Tax=Mytilinidion resinicola TaxID=574789 RepID=A0A6A6YJT0_9PEZI|nr:uncharacterized protein BDZ99DRAFT_533630 [Mytilinidion resinicola]KAF2809112.1 hypothetical protein BDZ99DRAFT_533630 [Mytilinidion resinicola]
MIFISTAPEELNDLLKPFDLTPEGLNLEFEGVSLTLDGEWANPYEAGRLLFTAELLAYTIISRFSQGMSIFKVEEEARNFLEARLNDGTISEEACFNLNPEEICLSIGALTGDARDGDPILEGWTREDEYWVVERIVIAALKIVAVETLPFIDGEGTGALEKWDDDDVEEFERGYRDGDNPPEEELPPITLEAVGEKIDISDFARRIECPLPPDMSCAICLLPLAGAANSGDWSARTSCDHYFHDGCLSNWINESAQANSHRCPCCRTELCDRRERRPIDD